MLSSDIPIPAVKASQVEEVVLDHCNNRISPTSFSIQSKWYTFNAKLLKPRALRTHNSQWETIRLKATQIPLLINNATTGHKLQGSSVNTRFVHNWSKVTNWTYVMLSRVRTRARMYNR